MYIRKPLFLRIYTCILADFALISAKCTYENGLFLKIICAQGLSEVVFDENARIKTDIFRFSYVFAIAPDIDFEKNPEKL